MSINLELAEHKDGLIKLKRQKCLIDPTVYISISRNATGTEFYLGRGHWINKDKTTKSISIYLGKTDKFDPTNLSHLEMAKGKLISQIQKQLLAGKIN